MLESGKQYECWNLLNPLRYHINKVYVWLICWGPYWFDLYGNPTDQNSIIKTIKVRREADDHWLWRALKSVVCYCFRLKSSDGTASGAQFYFHSFHRVLAAYFQSHYRFVAEYATCGQWWWNRCFYQVSVIVQTLWWILFINLIGQPIQESSFDEVSQYKLDIHCREIVQYENPGSNILCIVNSFSFLHYLTLSCLF